MIRKSTILITTILALLAFAAAAKAGQELPEKKKTSLGLYLSAQKAYTMWKSNPVDVAIIDCRTPEEYVFVGHPPMAHNIPFMLMTTAWDKKKKNYKMEANPGFVEEIKKRFNKDQTLILICRSGGRSAKGTNLLADAGYKNVYTVTDGFEGDKVKDSNSYFKGQRMLNGWKNSGNPWTYGCEKDLVYLPVR
jgi:rhodanese-related sulfurtransferase